MTVSVPAITDAPATIVVGVSAGIASYKTCEVVRRLAEAGHQVQVVATPDALRFVGAATWEALSGNPVRTTVWEDVAAGAHIELAAAADVVVVAPATADLLAKAAAGMADSLLTTLLLAATAPVLLVPAMHTQMWQHPATQTNVATLRKREVVVMTPATGRLAGADTGAGRLPEASEIVAATVAVLHGHARGDLAGRRVVVSAGGTREAIDPVRFLGNASSGLQGYALARTAALRGAQVQLVAANVALPDPAGVEVIRVTSALELREQMVVAAAQADVVVMAAAVADWRPAAPITAKIRKDGSPPPAVELVENPDILAQLSASRPRPDQLIVGFAAETFDHAPGADGQPHLQPHQQQEHNARRKMQHKGCDLLVLNEVGGEARGQTGFGTADNAAVILGALDQRWEVSRRSKDDLAQVIWDVVVAEWKKTSR